MVLGLNNIPEGISIKPNKHFGSNFIICDEIEVSNFFMAL
jgi:hypothetical protein